MNTPLNQTAVRTQTTTPEGLRTFASHYYNTLILQLETGNYRFGMQSVMLIVQGNVIAPISLLVFQYYDFGYQDYFAGLACILFFSVLVANLALLPVRLTLTIFWINLALHVGLVAYHLLR